MLKHYLVAGPEFSKVQGYSSQSLSHNIKRGPLYPNRYKPYNNKKKTTNSVYDSTVEDVEYICNSNSTLSRFHSNA